MTGITVAGGSEAPVAVAPGLARPTSLREADAVCRRLAATHYENFTVASALLPRGLRRDLARVYAYCRTTDDLGDETGSDAGEPLRRWRGEVEACLAGGAEPTHPVLVALLPTVRAHGLPVAPFLDLVDANLQDQVVHAYRTWPELHAYCRLSAAPVGRMVLGITGMRSPRALQLSDDVCIGLQLANFAQDVAVDAGRGRVYLLGEEVERAGTRGAVRLMCDRAVALLDSGCELEAMAHGRVRLQLALYRLGGLAIVDAIRRAGYATDLHRPAVGAAARVRIGLRALSALRSGHR